MRKGLNALFVLVAIVISCLLLNACKKGIPKNVIRPSEMQNVLYDYHMAQTMAGDLSYEDEYKKTLYIDYVFQKHHVTQAQFDSSMVWYTREAEELTKIYEQLNKRLKDQQNTLNHQIALRDKKPQITAEGDTVDVWYADRLYCLTDSPVSNKLEFSVPGDANFRTRDNMEWKLRHTFLGDEKMSREAVMALSICFDNDSVISEVRQLKRSGITSIRLETDSIHKIKEVRGFVYYQSANEQPHSLLLDQISLIRYHETKQNASKTGSKDVLKKVMKNIPSTDVKDTVARKNILEEVQSVRLSPQEMNHSHAKKR